MKLDFIQYLANYSVASDNELIIQTATGTFTGNPIFEDSNNEIFNTMMDNYDKLKVNDSSDDSKLPMIALENVRNIETGLSIPFLIFFEESILAISFGYTA